MPRLHTVTARRNQLGVVETMSKGDHLICKVSQRAIRGAEDEAISIIPHLPRDPEEVTGLPQAFQSLQKAINYGGVMMSRNVGRKRTSKPNLKSQGTFM